MKFEDFKFITEKLLKHEQIKNKTCIYLSHEELFDSIEFAVDRLLDEIYNPIGIEEYCEKVFSGQIEDYESLYKFMEENKI